MSRPPTLSRGTVDRRTAARTDDGALDSAWASDRARLMLLTGDGRTPFAMGGLRLGAPESASRPADSFYLGSDSDGDYFAQVVDGEPPTRGRLVGLRDVGADLDDRDAGLLVHAVALANWHATHTHCPRCGSPTVVAQGGHVRTCPQDGSTHFPRTDPAVIMLVTDPAGTQALLGRQPSWPPGRYSTLAGFAEPGESAEQAVVREVAEETGVTAAEVRYVTSQPWPFPASLMLGFRAIADPTQPLVLGQDELEDARWFDRADIEAERVMLPPAVSIARRLVDGWLSGE